MMMIRLPSYVLPFNSLYPSHPLKKPSKNIPAAIPVHSREPYSKHVHVAYMYIIDLMVYQLFDLKTLFGKTRLITWQTTGRQADISGKISHSGDPGEATRQKKKKIHPFSFNRIYVFVIWLGSFGDTFTKLLTFVVQDYKRQSKLRKMY